MCVYIFSGRFQPFHNGHMQVFEQLCKKINVTDTIVIGVIAPFEPKKADIKDKDFFRASEEHHLPDRNPWEVTIPLYAVSRIARLSHYTGRIITTLLPRPECGWQTIQSWFPQKRIWVIPSAGEDFDEKKCKYFTKMGDGVIRFQDTTDISGRELREFYKKRQYKKFADNVPSEVVDIYFKEKPDDSAEYDFQKRAEKFEEHSRWVTDESINNVPKEFFEQHKISMGDILDAGGGTGYLVSYLFKHMQSKPKSISLVDISRNMLDIAEKKTECPITVYNASIETFCQFTTKKFDTILLRQVLHYVEDVNDTVSLLKNVLKKGGYIYVGQILVIDEECRQWHDELMEGISKNRRRTFVFDELTAWFEQNGFDIIEKKSDDFEEKFSDLFKRRVSSYEIPIKRLLNKMENVVTNSLRKKMSIRFEDDDLYYKVKFVHLLLKKR